MKKKILLFIASGGGGAEKVSTIYSRILHRAGFQVKNIILDSNNKDIYKFLPKEIEYEVISGTSRIARYLKIAKTIFRENPDIVFSSATALSAVLVIVSMIKRNTKVITRQCFTPGTKSKWVERTIALLFDRAKVNIAQTVEMRDEMISRYHLNPTKVVAINNPLDLVDIHKKTSDINRKHKVDYSYVTVGRIDPQKDYITLVKAFALVVKEKTEAHLTIIGSKRSESYYQQVIDAVVSSKLEGNISFVDYTDNPFKYELESNCFVLSSVTEGLPNVLLEAMFLNIPCVATRSIPFIASVIKQGVNGYTVEVGDYKGLAEAMLAAPNLLGKIANNDFNDNIQKQIINVFSK